MPQPDKDRFLFVHVMKTGGTSFTGILKANFDDSQLYPESYLDADTHLMQSMSTYMHIPQLLANVNTHGEQLRMVRAHVPYAVRSLLDQRFRVLTILRDPVERTLSHLKHARKYHPEHSGMALEEIYEDPWFNASLLRNYQTKMFSMSAAESLHKNHFPADAPELPTPRELAEGHPLTEELTAFRESFPTRFLWGLFAPCTGAIEVDETRLATAKNNLAEVDLVGITEEYDRFLKQLEQKFDWKIRSVPHLHAGAPAATISTEFRKRITSDNAFDMAFYEYARSLAP